MKCEKVRYIIALLLLAIIAVMLWPAQAEETGVTVYAIVDEGSYLNVRLKPDRNSERIARIERGDALTVYEQQDGWYRTDEGGEYSSGWIYGDYISTEPPGDPVEMVVVSNGRVRVRETPDGSVIGYVVDGAKVTVTHMLGGWARCNRGWISGEYLEPISGE